MCWISGDCPVVGLIFFFRSISFQIHFFQEAFREPWSTASSELPVYMLSQQFAALELTVRRAVRVLLTPEPSGPQGRAPCSFLSVPEPSWAQSEGHVSGCPAPAEPLSAPGITGHPRGRGSDPLQAVGLGFKT